MLTFLLKAHLRIPFETSLVPLRDQKVEWNLKAKGEQRVKDSMIHISLGWVVVLKLGARNIQGLTILFTIGCFGVQEV